MATIYVSQTATNGYQVGSDSNDGSTKALAKLTVQAALTAAASGDTVKINSGTYVAATYFDTGGGKSITISPEVDGEVELKATSGTQVLVFQIQGLPGSIGAIRINAQGLRDNCVSIIGSTTLAQTTFTGTIFVDPTDCAVVDSKTKHSVTMTGVVLEAPNLAAVDAMALRERLYRASGRVEGVTSISGARHTPVAVGKSVNTYSVIKNSVTTVRKEYR